MGGVNGGGQKGKALLFLNGLAKLFTVYEKVSKMPAICKPCAIFKWQWAVCKQLYF
jgi:hypothetical protein